MDKANQSIKSVNASLSSMEASATKSAKGATQGIDGMTAAMVKGATAGSLFADSIKGTYLGKGQYRTAHEVWRRGPLGLGHPCILRAR